MKIRYLQENKRNAERDSNRARGAFNGEIIRVLGLATGIDTKSISINSAAVDWDCVQIDYAHYYQDSNHIQLPTYLFEEPLPKEYLERYKASVAAQVKSDEIFEIEEQIEELQQKLVTLKNQ